MAVKQVAPWAMFPSGDYRSLLELRFDPDELERRYGLHFSQKIDDLDYFKLAAIALPDGSQAWLTKYRGEQGPGTVVDIDVGANFAQVKRQIESMMGLHSGDITWVSPFVAHPEQKPVPRGRQRAG